MAYWIGNGKQLTDNEYEEYQRQQLEEQERVKQRTEALIQKLGQTYDELTRLLEQSPEAARQVAGETTKDKETYLRLKQRLELANMAPRCRWVKQGGTACGSPQMKKHIYCFAHMQMMEARELMLRLPPPEDANAIQIGLMRIQKSLMEDTISTKKAGLLLYSMQLALTNVGRTTFGQAKEEEMVRNTVDEVEALREDQPPTAETRRHGEEKSKNLFTTEDAKDTEEEKSQNQTFETQRNRGSGGAEGLPRIHGEPGQVYADPRQAGTDERGLKNQEPFTTADTHSTRKLAQGRLRNTEEEKILPLMNADERGLESGIKPVYWRPTPDMYRTDTPEGRAAYEACLRLTIAPGLGGERRPPQPVIAPQPAQKRPVPGAPAIAPEEHAETYAVLG